MRSTFPQYVSPMKRNLLLNLASRSSGFSLSWNSIWLSLVILSIWSFVTCLSNSCFWIFLVLYGVGFVLEVILKYERYTENDRKSLNFGWEYPKRGQAPNRMCSEKMQENGRTCKFMLQNCPTRMNWDCPFIEVAWRVYAWHVAWVPPIFSALWLLASSRLSPFQLTILRAHLFRRVLFHYLKNMRLDTWYENTSLSQIYVC